MTYFRTIALAIKTVLNKWTYQVAFAVLTISLIALYISIPVATIPGDTLSFQMGLYTPTEFVLFALLSLTTSLLILFQVFIFSHLHEEKNKGQIFAQGGVGILSGLFAGVLTSITCVPCVIGFLGIFGSIETILVISEYQTYFAVAALFIVLLGIYYTSLRVTNQCKACTIQ